jgi:hypothetical protein
LTRVKKALTIWLIVIVASIVVVLTVPLDYAKEALIVTMLINFLAAALYFKFAG